MQKHPGTHIASLALLTLLASSAGCSTPSDRPSKSTDAAAPTAQATPAPAPEQTSGSSLSASPQLLGHAGNSISYATHSYIGATGLFPQAASDLLDRAPFLGSFGNFELVRSQHPNGSELLLCERIMPSGSQYYGDLRGQTISPSGYEGSSIPLGIDGETERYLLTHIDVLTSEALQGYAQNVRGNLPGCTLGTDGKAPENSIQGQSISPEGDLMALKVTQLGDAIGYYQAEGPTKRSAQSLDELASHYGGMNSAFWTNPYTNLPMQEVEPANATPGDYSLKSSEFGIDLTFYYLACDGATVACELRSPPPPDPNALENYIREFHPDGEAAVQRLRDAHQTP